MALKNKAHWKAILKEHYPLIGILLGSFLVALSLGPYTNFDSQTEFAAASSVVKSGLPYATPGNLINQPPVGFYINAVFLRIFGLSYETGVTVITLFGVACVFLVYEVGKTLYGKRTGLLAAAIFGITPWHVVFSRSFLIDTHCLFFSLLYLLVGIWAIRKGSLKLFFVAGTLFGVALLTKLFAVFLLIPLALFYLYWRPKNLKHALAEIFLFFLPALLFYFLWYEVISGLGFFSPLTHNDFSTSIPNGTAMSPFFLLYFFNENPGLFLLLVCTISLGLSLWKRRLFTKTYAFDLICAATIVSVAGLNSYLALARNLWVPYVNPIKYDYLILPAFCCLAASLASKYNLLRREAVSQKWRNKLALLLATVGLALLVVAFIVNMIVLATVIGASRLTFKVDPIVGYSFDRLSPVAEPLLLSIVQFLGLILIVFSLLWVSKDKLLPHR